MTSRDIEVLSGLEGLRRRPGMFLGRGNQAVSLLEVAMSPAIDALWTGRARRLRVVLHADGSASVSDDGPGLPTETMAARLGIPFLEAVMTCTAHAPDVLQREDVARRFGRAGLSLVAGLSLWTRVVICRDGRRHVQRFRREHPEGPLVDAGPADGQGMTIRFLPDYAIVEGWFDPAAIRLVLLEVAAGATVCLALEDRSPKR
jgi:DNA gyrase/topoisomerase IV subunit B